MSQPPEHLSDKYRVYAITMTEDYQNRSEDRSIIVHVARPLSFKTFCETYILQHMELTVESSGAKIPTGKIAGLQKIPNQNTPKYEITADGVLKGLV